MLKKYRKNFVVFTMALIGAVLAAVFVFIGVYMYENHSRELRVTMEQVLRPLDRPTGRFRSIDGELPDGEMPQGGLADGKPEDGGIDEYRRPDGERRDLIGSDAQIVTVFYTPESGEISVLSGSGIDESTLADAVAVIASSEDSFGKLNGYGLIYMCEKNGDAYKIALADSSYLSGRVWRSVIVLALIYLGAMGLIFVVSLRISKRAAKPMENAIEMERQFVADISHDLKTPITVILANNSILKENSGETVGSQSQWIESTDDAAHGMMDLISRMLTLSALEAKDRSEALYGVDLSNVTEKILLQLDSVAYDRGIELREEIEEGVCVKATKEYAERIVTVLVDNALKYEKSGGRVEVTLAAAKKRATLTVRNSSSYISPEDLPHIFERFYRADRSRTEKSGYGLGLPTVKRVTELVGAHIGVESTKESGTAFTVVFPIAAE